MIFIFFYSYLQFMDDFFMDSDPDFSTIRIRTQEKSLIRIQKNPDPKHWLQGTHKQLTKT